LGVKTAFNLSEVPQVQVPLLEQALLEWQVLLLLLEPLLVLE
jgi:hypothetical protein